jgi:hypothetical protein
VWENLCRCRCRCDCVGVIVPVSVTVVLIVSVTVSVSVKLTSSVVAGVEGRSSEKLDSIDGCIVRT